MIHSIKTAIDPICARMEIPKKDKERLIKIFASQKRFFKTEEHNPTHNEVFRKKDFSTKRLWFIRSTHWQTSKKKQFSLHFLGNFYTQ